MSRNNLISGHDARTNDTYRTGTFTPGRNRLVLAFVISAQANSTTPPVPDLDGNSVRWELVRSVVGGQREERRLSCFRAMDDLTREDTLEIDFDGEEQDFCAWSVFEYTDVEQGDDGENAIARHEAASVLGATTLSFNPGNVGPDEIVVAGMMLDLVNDPVRPVTPGAGFTEIDEVAVVNLPGATLQTQERTGGSGPVSWSWQANQQAEAIILVLKGLPRPAGPTPSGDDEDLAAKFAPILFFHPQESFLPIDPKAYLQKAALWSAAVPFDAKSSWGGSAGASFPRVPLVKSGEIALMQTDPGEWIGGAQFTVDQSDQERFLELGAWKDVVNAPVSEVTATSSNIYANRQAIFDAFSDPNINHTWYAEIFDRQRMLDLSTIGDKGLDYAAVISSLRDPKLLNYYIFYPAHEQTIDKDDATCVGSRIKEYACHAGDWTCISVLLEAPVGGGPHEPTFVGSSGLPMGYGEPYLAPFAYDPELRVAMRVQRWRPATGPVASLPELTDGHPRFYVSRGSHYYYTTPGDHGLDYLPSGPQLCGDFEGSEVLPEGAGETDGSENREQLGAILVKIVGGAAVFPPAGWIAGFVAAGLEGLLGFGLDVVGTADTTDPAQTPTAGAGPTIVPGDVIVPEAGAGAQPWTLEMVDRKTQAWWPSEDLTKGFRGRWGQRVEDDSLSVRAGVRFPEFWRMFLTAYSRGLAAGSFKDQ
jgi:hypothetical protein